MPLLCHYGKSGGGTFITYSIRKLLLCVITLCTVSPSWAQTELTWKTTSDWENQQECIKHAGEVYNITFQDRIFNAYEWNGICLPFDADKTTIDNTLGEGKYEIQIYSETEESTLIFKKITAEATIPAGTPCLLKTTVTIENPKFHNVRLTASITPDFIKKETGNAAIELRGSYFHHHTYELYDKDNKYSHYIVKTDGTLEKNLYSNNGFNGIFAYIFVNNQTTTPKIKLEGSTTGGEGDTDPEKSSLQQKIEARMQLTDIPTLYITLPEIGEQKLSEYLYKDRTNDYAPYRPAKIHVAATMDTTDPRYIDPTQFEGELMDDLQIKVRGNSTADPEKRAYRIKFEKKHDMFNQGYKEKSWTLLANVFDKSLIRNAVTYHLCKYIGMPFAAGYKFVDLVINNEYRGTYQISDHVQVKSSRININEDTGWYIEFQGRQDMCDNPNLTDSKYGEHLINVKNPDTDDLTPETKEELLTGMGNWFTNKWKSGFSGSSFDPDHGWRAYNDEETLMKFLIATEITGDYDGLMTIKAYRDIDTKLFWGPIWDKDLAYGNYGDYEKTMVKDLDNSSFVKYDFRNYIFKDPMFTKEMSDFMNNLVQNQNIKEKLIADIDNIAGIVKESRKLDYEKWGDQSQGIESQHGHGEDYQWYVDELKRWLSNRIDFVQKELQKISDENNPGTSNETFTYNTNKYIYENGIYSYLNKIVNAKIAGRKFICGEYNPLSVPFRITSEQLTGIFGENYELKELTYISEDGKTLHFDTPEGNYVKSACPYLIKPTKEVVAEPVVENVILYNATQQMNGMEVTMGNYTFKGNMFADSDLAKDGTIKLITNDAKELTILTNGSLQGSYAYIKINNGAEDPVISFNRKTEDNETLIFDTNAPEAETRALFENYIGKCTNIQIKNRTFSKDYWNTLSLPFDATKEQMEAAFGEGYSLQETSEANGLTMRFKEKNDGIAAGVPYMIKPVSEVTEPEFKNVTIKTLNNEKVGGDMFRFVSAIAGHTWAIDKSEVFYLRGKLYYPTENTVALQGTRAYFELPITTAATKFTFIMDDGTTTNIEPIRSEINNHFYNIYNLNGQQIDKQIDALPKGIYIINGKKTVIK